MAPSRGPSERIFLLPSEIGPEQIPSIGGKARGLLRLEQAGLPVPAWCVIPASVARLRSWRTSREARSCLESLQQRLAVDESAGWIVRSSDETEDETAASSAGLLASRRVPLEGDLVSCIEEVLDSRAGRGVASYAHHRGLSQSAGLSVVVQRWIEARIAGVLFSAHPVHGKPETFLLEVVQGPADELVGGRLNPSRFEVDFRTRQVVRAQPEPAGPAALEQQLLDRLAEHTLRVEESLGTLADIEWALGAGNLWFLQARPITSLQADPALLPSFPATSWFFDQRFLEPIRPMTASALIPTVVRLAIREPLEMLGRAVPEPLVTYFGGQVYIRHSAYRSLVSGLPRAALPPDFRQVIDLERSSEREPQEEVRSSGSLPYLGHAIGALARHWREWLRNGSSWQRLRRELEERLRSLEPLPAPARRDWLARWNELEACTVQLLRLHRWSLLLADSSFGIFRWLSRKLPERTSTWLEDAVTEAATLPTAEGNRHLARALQGRGQNPQEMYDFLRTYGHRSPSLDFAVPTWEELLSEEPRPSSPPVPAREPGEAVPRRRRRKAVFLRPLVRLLEMREEQRFEWERVLARQRHMLRDAGIELARRGELSSSEDVWLMTWEELVAALFEGTAVGADELRLRRHELRFNSILEKPLVLGGQAPAPRRHSLILAGVAAGRGRAAGKTWVLDNLTSLDAHVPAGSVLVARALDPAMTYLLPSVSAAVLERGGVLSHAAILAREYGVPLVTSVDGATDLLPSGTSVEVDGNRGTVTIQEQAPA